MLSGEILDVTISCIFAQNRYYRQDLSMLWKKHCHSRSSEYRMSLPNYLLCICINALCKSKHYFEGDRCQFLLRNRASLAKLISFTLTPHTHTHTHIHTHTLSHLVSSGIRLIFHVLNVCKYNAIDGKLSFKVNTSLDRTDTLLSCLGDRAIITDS